MDGIFWKCYEDKMKVVPTCFQIKLLSAQKNHSLSPPYKYKTLYINKTSVSTKQLQSPPVPSINHYKESLIKNVSHSFGVWCLFVWKRLWHELRIEPNQTFSQGTSFYLAVPGLRHNKAIIIGQNSYRRPHNKDYTHIARGTTDPENVFLDLDLTVCQMKCIL